MTPTEQSIELFKRAGQPCELHLFSDADHFMFAESNTRVWNLLRGWLGDYFPAMTAVKKVAASAGQAIDGAAGDRICPDHTVITPGS